MSNFRSTCSRPKEAGDPIDVLLLEVIIREVLISTASCHSLMAVR